jgi:hypothetical protein
LIQFLKKFIGITSVQAMTCIRNLKTVNNPKKNPTRKDSSEGDLIVPVGADD